MKLLSVSDHVWTVTLLYLLIQIVVRQLKTYRALVAKHFGILPNVSWQRKDFVSRRTTTFIPDSTSATYEKSFQDGRNRISAQIGNSLLKWQFPPLSVWSSSEDLSKYARILLAIIGIIACIAMEEKVPVLVPLVVLQGSAISACTIMSMFLVALVIWKGCLEIASSVAIVMIITSALVATLVEHMIQIMPSWRWSEPGFHQRLFLLDQENQPHKTSSWKVQIRQHLLLILTLLHHNPFLQSNQLLAPTLLRNQMARWVAT